MSIPSRLTRIDAASFGIRGIGSLFYVAYAAGQASFGIAERQLWAVVSFVVLVSVVLHGITATPVMNRLDTLRHERLRRRGVAEPTDHELANEHV